MLIYIKKIKKKKEGDTFIRTVVFLWFPAMVDWTKCKQQWVICHFDCNQFQCELFSELYLIGNYCVQLFVSHFWIFSADMRHGYNCQILKCDTYCFFFWWRKMGGFMVILHPRVGPIACPGWGRTLPSPQLWVTHQRTPASSRNQTWAC